MEKTRDMPTWVYFVVASIETRRTALMLVYVSAFFTFYCIPWAALFPGSDVVAKVFLIEDWSWFVTMVPITLWYWLAVKWVDKNVRWKPSSE